MRTMRETAFMAGRNWFPVSKKKNKHGNYNNNFSSSAMTTYHHDFNNISVIGQETRHTLTSIHSILTFSRTTEGRKK